jgi:hypothetical protein
MIRIIAAMFALLALVSCVTNNEVSDKDTSVYSVTFKALDRTKKVLITPLSAQFEVLNKGSGVVMEVVAEQLLQDDWDVLKFEDDELFEKQWSQAVASVGGLYSSATGKMEKTRFEAAVTRFVSSLELSDEICCVLFPSLGLKRAKADGYYAKWDGVSRVIVEDLYTSKGRYYGSTKGVSVRIELYRPDGEWLFTSFGGLVLPYVVSGSRIKPSTKFKEGMFEDREKIVEGVAIALLPMRHEINRQE